MIITVSAFFALLAAKGVSIAQTTADLNAYNIRHWVDSVCTSNPAKRVLRLNADAYERFLELQAGAALGIDPSVIWHDPNDNYGSPSDLGDTGAVHNVSNDPNDFQNETSVVINRKWPNLVVVGANDARMSSDGMPSFYSNDTGKSWHTVFLPTVNGTQALGDPMLAYELDGSMYYAYMRAEVGLRYDNIVVATSFDGAHWTNGTPVIAPGSLGGFEDKEHICVDRSSFSTHYGRIYVVWTHFDSTGTTGSIRIAYSDDNCKTWSAPVTIENDLGHFAEVKTGKFGEVIVTCSFQHGDTLAGAHYLYVSTNGGTVFAKHYIAPFTMYPRNADYYPALKGNHGFRCYPYTTFDVNLFTDEVHVVYGDWFSGVAAVQYYTSTSNFGGKWTSPLAVGYGKLAPTVGTARDRFCPWVSINQITGEAFVSYYSSERDSANALISAYRLQLNADNDKMPKALEAADFDPRIVDTTHGKLPFIGDYLAGDNFDPVSASIWTEPDPVSLHGDIMGYVGIQKPTSSVGASIIRSDRLRIASVSPNPVTDHTVTINCYSPKIAAAELSLFDVRGNMIATLWKGTLDGLSSAQLSASLPALAAGTYFIRLSADGMSDECKIVVK
ncbi:MAG TPA: T9SS type A sorting domain-containing protein [Candidatus Kapabacteria bacterium]|nr:T9SS type A sorting domain-containing protein [Candidatus Kapabacteria bacterium]